MKHTFGSIESILIIRWYSKFLICPRVRIGQWVSLKCTQIIAITRTPVLARSRYVLSYLYGKTRCVQQMTEAKINILPKDRTHRKMSSCARKIACLCIKRIFDGTVYTQNWSTAPFKLVSGRHNSLDDFDYFQLFVHRVTRRQRSLTKRTSG